MQHDITITWTYYVGLFVPLQVMLYCACKETKDKHIFREYARKVALTRSNCQQPKMH